MKPKSETLEISYWRVNAQKVNTINQYCVPHKTTAEKHMDAHVKKKLI
jgi:hypothetical protein